MGVCYTLLLQDEFNWGYVGTDKEKKLKEFEEEFAKLEGGYLIERVGAWYGYVVYDIDKQYPFIDKRKELIKKYCDNAFVIDDLQPWNIAKLD